ncbi:glycerol-3-phosphate dehydrogenase [Celerinatantimonas sp. MCCC 1A17872]|uniref:glycerol-3-phosphate dehydrogenase n=1 Tax=Celerinatantimonas sp. MCCC 1A17872 TaxID=3177514 RepID=UPI0038C53004
MAIHEYDLVVIGGGINGSGIAADAAERGLKVALFEAKDFASATSSASSKLIHGGLRYLEQYEFRLVREALGEREVLLQKAPHLITPMRFRLPHRPHLRPAWMIRIGLFLYDHLAKRVTLPASCGIRFDPHTSALQSQIRKGFEYSDGWVDDSRLVVANLMHARELGADVYNYRPCVSATRDNGQWLVTVQDERSGETSQVRAKALVNAGGPWVKSIFDEQLKLKSPRGIRMIQGSHILVPQIHKEKCAYILQNEDGRIVFVIPYLNKYSLIGTTDLEYKGDPRQVHISESEIDYLCNVVNNHFKHNIRREEIIWSYSGVRPLCEDESDSPQAITRDYTLELQDEQGQTPLVSIFGGKLTTFRKLAEAAVNKLQPYFNCGDCQSEKSILPGGNCDPEQLATQLLNDYPFLNKTICRRIAHAYGTNVFNWLEGAHSKEELGQWFGEQLSQREVDYLVSVEWALSADDILWRRTKLGIITDESDAKALADYLPSMQSADEAPMAQVG